MGKPAEMTSGGSMSVSTDGGPGRPANVDEGISYAKSGAARNAVPPEAKGESKEVKVTMFDQVANKPRDITLTVTESK